MGARLLVARPADGRDDVRATCEPSSIAGSFLRTHILRPTWHFVAAEDLGWISRGHRAAGATAERHHLPPVRPGPAPAGSATATTIVEALTGGQYRTRAELGRLLGASGIALAYLVMNAELEGVICQRTDAWRAAHVRAGRRTGGGTPATGDAAELAYRFFVGHGPASVRDLARWASLTRRQAAEATEAAAPRLTRDDGGRRDALARPGGRRSARTVPRTGPCCCRCTTS